MVANTNIKKGSLIKQGMLACKRPGTGLAPRYLDNIIGKHALRDLATDCLVTLDDFE